jgi:uncharacterized membrane protein YkvA (DUF1232 family)
MPNFIENIKQKARELKKEVFALYFAFRDKRTPWYAKAFSALVLAYAFSPIDLIPDFVPVLGYLDDLVIIPAGITLALKMIPANIMAEARVSAESHIQDSKPLGWAGAAFIILIWAAVLFLIYRLVASKVQIQK